MKWIVTHSKDYPHRVGTGNATPKEAQRFEERWRTLDGDGNVFSFHGKCDRIGFLPLDKFCGPEVGDVEIQFKDHDGKWREL
ncbi:MAG: hypothetical protein LBT97_02905 [Planctomycetota bacterium]|jgi:hypothetical protein|nr:hypothetical protein [Planctomycetota bacterium]